MLAAQSKLAGEEGVHPSKSVYDSSWKHLVEPVEPFLEMVTEQLMRQVRGFDPEIVPYARYALAGNGKRLRPTLVALAANSVGPIHEAHTTAAVIIEIVHLATLVHDDVMDEAEIRRGQPTLASNWGNEIAVLFGDCLFAQAVTLAASFPTPDVCRAVAAATNTVCAGEILQTRSRRDFPASRREYFRVIEMKTAELFLLSCDLAAFLSRAPTRSRNALREFGAAFGTAYQLYDDCLDLFGTETVAGKSLGTDLEKGKLTWPLLLAWERADPADRARLEKIIENWQPENFALVNDLLARYGTLEPSVAVIRRYLEAARQALRPLPDTHGRMALAGLADFLAQQTDALAVSIQ